MEHCKYGHAFNAANTRVSVLPDGRTHRECRPCNRIRARLRRRFGRPPTEDEMRAAISSDYALTLKKTRPWERS
jgi:hypothetical protein